METALFSPLVESIIQASGKLAVKLNYESIVPDHLLLSIIDESLKTPTNNILLKAFKHLNINLFNLIDDIEQSFDKYEKREINDRIPFSRGTEHILKLSFLEAKSLNSLFIEAEHLLLSYLRADDTFSKDVLQPKHALTYDKVKEAIKFLR
jgi:ATP-dependent Clp protease ATP-binding subunit ClpC